ncbi:MAG: glycoside hydrolase family 36 protein, partial [Bryobacteraceae bacterium]
MSNGSTSAGFQLNAAGNFVFVYLADSATGASWNASSSFHTSPINLRVENTVYDAYTQFRLVTHRAGPIPRRGFRQTIVLEDTAGQGRITLELEMFENAPFLRQRVRFRNLRPSMVKVRYADILPLAFDAGDNAYRLFHVNQWVQAGKMGNFEPVESNLAATGELARMTTGAHGQHCAWLAIRDANDRGLVAGWEFDGRATATIRSPRRFGYLQLSVSLDDLNRPLERDQALQLPASFIGLYRGDWDEAGYRTQRFAEAAIAKAMPDPVFPFVIWDSWKYQTAIDEATLRRNAEIAARIGVEVFVVDLGWARQIGDWHADPQKFPSGMRALSDYVHSLGMKFGLHFPLAEAMKSSPMLRANPDWTSSESYGYFEAESICLSHRPVREWVIQEAVRMIDAYNVDWILQDGENMVKKCTKTTHGHDPQDSNFSNAVDGLNFTVTAIQAQRPNVIWENCEDGGNMMTYNMVRNYQTSIASDDSGAMTTRQAVYGITYPFPPRYSDRYMPDEELGTYTTRSFMFGGPWIFMNRLAS